MWGLLPPFSTAVTALVLGAALGLLRSKVFRVFPLDDQIFRNVIWVLLHSHNRTFLKTGYSISSTSIRGKVWNANLRLLEEVDTFFDPLTELLLRFLTLSQIPFRQHLLHLGGKRRKFDFIFFADRCCHLAEGSQDGSSLLLISRIDHIIHACHVLGIFLHLGKGRNV